LVESIQRLEDAGASAVVMYSLFEGELPCKSERKPFKRFPFSSNTADHPAEGSRV
jgi:hypothetical protein